MPTPVKVFLGWSGQRSHAVATALNEWLPSVIQAIDPWISVEMDRGAQWFQNIGANLKAAKYGIICITPENASEQWVLFEAGALALSTSDRLACPYLLDMAPADLRGPLAQLQAARADRADTWRVVETINGLLEADSLTETRLRGAFDQWWAQLEGKLDAARKIAVAAPAPPQRSDGDKLDELVAIARDLQRGTTRERVLAPPVVPVPGDPTRAAFYQSLMAGMGYNDPGATIAAQIEAQRRGFGALGALPPTPSTAARPGDEPSKPAPSARPREDVRGKIGKPPKSG
jgi:hypothetical protein